MTPPRAPLDAVAAALAVVNRSGMVSAINAAFTDLTGWTGDALAGRRIDAICTAASVSGLNRVWIVPGKPC